jgi:hypothetical protein
VSGVGRPVREPGWIVANEDRRGGMPVQGAISEPLAAPSDWSPRAGGSGSLDRTRSGRGVPRPHLTVRGGSSALSRLPPPQAARWRKDGHPGARMPFPKPASACRTGARKVCRRRQGRHASMRITHSQLSPIPQRSDEHECGPLELQLPAVRAVGVHELDAGVRGSGAGAPHALAVSCPSSPRDRTAIPTATVP